VSSDIEQEYQQRLSIWNSLREEVVFTLNEAISARDLKIHQVESRVKSISSVIGKVASKNYQDPIEDMTDIVGVRVVVLFNTNLNDIDDIIYKYFDVISKDDKASNVDSALGYRSVHYVCIISSKNSGPRYDKILGIKFEIQVRTICMHAWAAVSHYLDYKGDWDVPKELKGSLRALSGLFHVADSQFEQFFSAREQYHDRIVNLESVTSKDEIDLESVSSYLEKKFPQRMGVDKVRISPFVQEILELGINSFRELDNTIDKGLPILLKIENKNGSKFAQLGAARISMALVSQQYRNIKYDGKTLDQVKETFSRRQDD